MIISKRLFTVGRSNPNGAIYSEEMVNSIINYFENYGYILGQEGSLDNGASIEVTKVTHQVIELCLIRDIHLFARIEFLETPMSRKFLAYFKDRENEFVFKPEGTGTIDPQTNLIYDYNIIAVNAIKKSQRQSQQTILNKNEDR